MIKRVEPLIPPELAVICGRPMATPVASPALMMVASVVSELLHATVDVTSAALPSLNLPIALNCCLALIATDGLAGETCIAVSVFEGGSGEEDGKEDGEEEELHPTDITAPTAAMVASAWKDNPNCFFNCVIILR